MGHTRGRWQDRAGSGGAEVEWGREEAGQSLGEGVRCGQCLGCRWEEAEQGFG